MGAITGNEDTVAGAVDPTVQEDSLSHHRDHPRALTAGDRVGRYVVLGTLGEGGMGVVLAAYDPELDRKVAVKLVRPSVGSSNSRARMVREARSMAQLAHPNVVSVFDAGEHEGSVYIAMEFVEGETLTKRLPELSDWRAVIEPLEAAGQGLAAAHERGLVHRDFKPDNVMVGDDGRVLVMDFGLAFRGAAEGPSVAAAKAIEVSGSSVSASLGDSFDPQLTHAGAIMGTPAFMAPEQFSGAAVDERADQFAFCVALWQGLYGEAPFAGNDMWSLADSVTQGQRRPPPKGKSIPGWLFAVLDRGLAIDPEARWPNMTALLAAIERGRARRRNRMVAFVVAAPIVAGLVVYGGYQAWRSRVAQQCEAEASAQMQWPERSAALEKGMLGTELSFASTSYGQATEILDGWGQSWIEQRAAVCRDERIEHVISPEVREARAECLDSSNTTVTLLLDALEAGDNSLMVFAVDHVSLLTNLDPCLNDLALGARPRPTPEVRATVNAAEAQLNEMTVLHLRGRFDEAIKQGYAALEALESTGFTPGLASAKARVGGILVVMGRFDEARPMLEEAYFLAGAIEDDESAAMAARHLVGIGTGPPPYGIAWVRGWFGHATMMHTRLQMSQSLEQAEIDESLAVSLSTLDQPETIAEEIELIRASREIRASKLGQEHPGVIVADLNLAAYACDTDPKPCLEPMRATAERLRAALGPNHPTLVGMHLTIGSVAAGRGRIDEALAEIDLGMALATKLYGPEHPEVAQAQAIRAEVEALADTP